MLSAWFSLIITFVIFNLLFFVARLTSRFAEEKLRRCYEMTQENVVLMEGIDDVDTTATTTTTTEEKDPAVPLSLREVTATYLTHLENDEKTLTSTERVFFRAYNERVPLACRARHVTANGKQSLPPWMEFIAVLYNSPIVFHCIILAFCLAALLPLYPVFTLVNSVTPLAQVAVQPTDPPIFAGSGPPPPQARTQLNESEIRRLAIAHMSGENELYHCGERWRGETLQTCYTEDDDLAVVTSRRVDVKTNQQWMSRNSLEHARRNVRMDAAVLSDRNLRHYFTMYSLTVMSSDGDGGEQLFSHDGLVDMLDQMRREEEARAQHGYLCVCPVFLGLVANLTFFYRDGAWLLMHRPAIVRNNSFSPLVVSTVRTHFNSNIFPLSQRLHQLFGTQLVDLMHHESFVVEYSVPVTDDATLVLLGDLATRLKPLSRRPVVLGRTTQFTRAQQQLGGNDAICFVYCNRVNTLILREGE